MNRPSWIGQTLGGRYRMDELIGQGGMSAVYKAYDPNLRRVVAIKLIHPHLATDARFLSRFEEEAAAVAQLRHPNIVQVFDFNHDDEVYYMVQEFIPGETLQDRLRRLHQAGRRMPLSDAVAFTSDICAAVGYAHKRGMIHRDIKPANIMLDVQGRAILMDFGIVKILGGEKHTATGAVVGTALYLPPEVIRGETPDERSDQYSLGVTLFEMVSGKPPFESDSAMTLLMMHLNDPVPDLHSLRPEAPHSVVIVIEKALAKRREDRFTNMAEFAAALQGAAPDLPAGTETLIAAEPSRPPIDASLPTEAAIAGAIQAAASTSAPAAPYSNVTEPDEAIISSTPPLPTGEGRGEGQPPRGEGQPPRGEGQPLRGEGQPPLPTGEGRGEGLPPLPMGEGRGEGKSRPGWLLWAILGVAAIAAIAIFMLSRGASQATPLSGEATATAAPTETALIAIDLLTRETTPTVAAYVLPSLAPTLGLISTATEIPPPTPTLAPTIPAGVPYAVIRAITLDNQGRYVVDYETYEYTEKLPGQHVHFFFNTVDPQQAGNPGNGPWYLWGGPRPFDRYRQVDRPAAATQICALVANPDHSVRLLSGNCQILPDVNVTAPYEAQACLAGPDPAFPVVAQIPSGQPLLINGLSPDEAWWIVSLPTKEAETCWLPRARTAFQGDMSTLALVQPPEKPSALAVPALRATITAITLNADNRYVVEYQTEGFTEQLPGTHLHFFFDTFSADQVGATGGGNRLMYGGPSPFSGFAVADKPATAQQLCVLVANPDHSVKPDSGNCYPLP